MSSEQFEELKALLTAGFAAINRNLTQMLRGGQGGGAASGDPKKRMNMHRPLADFKHFDWASIGARIYRSDEDGASIVERDGIFYTRRAPDNKYEPGVWFNRSLGRNAEGKIEYERLITFQDPKEADGVSRKVQKKLQQAPAQGQPPQGDSRQPAVRSADAQSPGRTQLPAPDARYNCKPSLAAMWRRAFNNATDEKGGLGLKRAEILDAVEVELKTRDIFSLGDADMLAALRIVGDLVKDAEEAALERAAQSEGV